MFKVLFPLEQDEDGYPPVSSGTLWARLTKDGHYELRNIPFHARDISWGDVVAAKPISAGVVALEGVVQRSGHSTIRGIVFNQSDLLPLQQALEHLGSTWEGSDQPHLAPTVRHEPLATPPGHDWSAWAPRRLNSPARSAPPPTREAPRSARPS